ncbi:MAG: cytosine specific methyltransferase [Siphoviridae sp. ctjeG17]|nr:MAG: cytosine specific methyltransferase [Siphoviridae sp. ctjeG17]
MDEYNTIFYCNCDIVISNSVYGNKMKIGSLFSGIGGIEVGFEREGFTTEWFVEYDKYARAILQKQFPNTIIYGDITQLDFSTVPKIDILTGGFPCQDISNAGKRAGITGRRSSLWKYYLEAIRVLRPKYAIIENVAALANRGLDVVLSDLAQIGYDAEWYNISASAVGAPHRRERLFIIAYPHSGGHIYRKFEVNTTESREYAQCESISSSENVSNTNEWRWYERNQQQYHDNAERTICEDKSGERGEIRCVSGSGSSLIGWWATEPNICRVAHGVPFRMDRIKCLGNAVVPAVAQIFAQAIKEVEKQ